jgi:hypothetical protein
MATTLNPGTASRTTVSMTPSGDVLAVIEAKCTWRSPREGEEQLRYYVTEMPSARRLDSPRAVAGGSGPELGKPSPGVISGRANILHTCP